MLLIILLLLLSIIHIHIELNSTIHNLNFFLYILIIKVILFPISINMIFKYLLYSLVLKK